MSDALAPTPYVVDAPLAAPSSTTGLLEVFRKRYLLKLLVRREISARYSGSVLGLFWSYINPLSHFFIYYVVMGFIFELHKNVPNFAIHMFAGITIAHFFTETLGAGTRSIVRNRAVVKKMAVPREMFPVASMLVSLFHALPAILILLVACVFSDWRPDFMGLVAGFLGMAIAGVLGTAMALAFSVANVFFRDVSNAVNVLTNFVRFGVPMIYPYTQVAERFSGHVEGYLANPLAIAVLLFQRCFWIGTTHGEFTHAEYVAALPSHLMLRGVIALAGSLVVLGIAQLIFSRLENKIPERL